jgi:hypothetical protein
VRPTRGGRGGLSSRRLAWRQATSRRGPAAALWICLAAAAALPALLLALDAIAAGASLTDTLALAGGFSVRQDAGGVDSFDGLERLADARAAARTGTALVPLGALARLGPLRVLTLRTAPAPAGLAGAALTAVYAEHLAAHVSVVAGELPPDGLAGGETAVTMPQAAADRLGLHLSDRLCGDFGAPPTAQPGWCARIVGLWRPLAAGDPFWSGAPPGPELAMGRFDLFQLAGPGPPRPPEATIRFWAARGATTPGGAAALAGEVSALAADLGAPQRQVDGQLAGGLSAFDEHRRRVSAAIDALAALVAVLGLGAAGLAAGRLLDGQRRDLALLRARGWARGSAWLVAFGGLGALGLTAAAAGTALCLLAAAGLALPRSDLPGVLLTLAGSVAALLALLAALAARAVRDPSPGRRGAFAAAAAVLWTPFAWLPWGGGVPAALARLQLARRPDQHAGAAFVLTLAAAGAVFAALGTGLASGAAGEAALAAGAGGGVVLALAASGVHFRSAARRRQDEYGGLLAHGLPPEHVGRSAAAERAVTTSASLLVGCALGAVLALAVIGWPAR